MKILHTVEFYSPSVGGAQEVVRQLSERMVALGHDVTVATTKLNDRQSSSINGVKIVEFDISGNQVRGYHGDTNAYKKFLLENKFDVIMNYAAQQWTADLFFEVMDKISAKKIFVPCGFSGLFDPRYKSYFAAMPAILKQYDKTIYLSNDYRDINFARNHTVNNIVLIPNGVNEREFKSINPTDFPVIRRQLSIPEKNALIVTIGSHTGSKGHKECIEVMKRLKMRNVSLVIVSNMRKGCYRTCLRQSRLFTVFSPFSKKRILAINLNRDDTVRLLKASDLFLFLSNIECSPLVLFEAGAAKVPFVSTAVGNSSEISQWTGGGQIVPTVMHNDGKSFPNFDETEKIVRRLLADQRLRDRLGTCARASVMKNYTWLEITKRYLELYTHI